MWHRHERVRARWLIALSTALMSCAPATSAPVVTPPPAEATPPRTEPTVSALAPPEASVRAARSLSPSGLELGTMWTFENPPLDYWRERYGFTPDAAWLEHVRLSSVRYGQGCSASFVSPEGLVMTNHHCARQCIEDVSTADVDYVEAGFYAATRGDERVCPNLFLDQLVEISDVTARVSAAGAGMAGSEQIAQAMAAEAERIEQECAQQSGSTCQVVPLYQGGQHQLYRYRRYAPVKLVFAPELQAGFFGGDPDNFTYPRYALDIAFVRAYEGSGATPAATPHHFEWDAGGAAENELVLITGNPGSTSRLITVSQLMYERSYRHPFVVSLLEGQRRMLQQIAAQGPEQERAVREDLFSVENSLKAYGGQLGGLRDTLLVARKIAWEADFRRRVAESAAARQYADVWDELTRIQERKLEISPVLNLSNPALVGAQHLTLASQLAGFLTAAALPEADRPPAYAGDRFAEVQRVLTSPGDIPEAQALASMQLQLALAAAWLPPEHPLRRALFMPGETPEQAAQRLLRTSRVGDVVWRQTLIAAGATVADTISDPLFRAGGLMDSLYSALLPQWRAVTAEETVQRQRLARALFAVYGTQLPPDATFTLRISDGIVSRYPYNGTVAPPKTTIYGLYARAAEFENQDPWTLPPAWARQRDSVAMDVPLNFVATNDITGGNSGSPVIDREARVVGIAFDGNIEQLPNEFLFDPARGRTVAVHSAGILEALRNVYRAEALVAELVGR
ncbi:MAG TPA: S46 family peptidase [Longimicrobiales bacterium]